MGRRACTLTFVTDDRDEEGAGLPIPLPSGKTWTLEDALRKLSLRAGLPGARVYDLSASALRSARDKGVSLGDRFALALPASWLVNSPASSVVLRRWALAPAREAWLELLATLDAPAPTFATGAWKDVVRSTWPRLGDEASLVEAASKLCALLVPDRIPLMPQPAREFVLGPITAVEGTTAATTNAGNDATAFIAMVDFLCVASRENDEDLSLVAQHHTEVPLSGPQVLDRLLWFDSEGHRHWKKT